MKVSLNWLKEYVDFDLTPEALAEELDMTGTGVESIQYFGRDMQNIVVGQIKKIGKHPNADKLTVCQVDIGKRELLNIVCGAPNAKEGAVVPLALVGAKLPNGFEIQQAKIRGAVSEGMMCSEAELELGEDTSGLMMLEEGAPIGEEISKFLGLEDVVLELEITPNRPDCLGMIGIAREIAAITGNPLRIPQIDMVENGEEAEACAQVEILDADLCPRYTAKIIKDIRIISSPKWMQQRLERAGVRPINNVVDITNYVMLETSQPLHAFDYDRLVQNRIIVRKAKKGETMVSLDDVTRQLDASMLVIADAKKPIALAGVMGGLYSEVSAITKNILLESAHFNPRNIMRTARRLGMQSEAAARFEKHIDPSGTVYAANRAAKFMAEFGGGRVLKGQVDVYPKPIKASRIDLSTRKVNKFLGTRLSKAKMVGILQSLQFEVSEANKGKGSRLKDADIRVTIPTFRPDLEREVDLIEEIVRLYGYNKVKSTLPESRGNRGGLSARQKLERRTRDFLISAGLREVIGYGFISPGDFDKMGLSPDCPLRQVVNLLNPLSSEQSVMRSTLIPGLLTMAKYNVNREQSNVQIFEMGRVFKLSKKQLPYEIFTLGGALTGSWHSNQWYEEAAEVDFFDMKGVMGTLFDHLKIDEWHLISAVHPSFHPGRCAEIIIENQAIGIMGEIHPEVQQAFDIPERIQHFEINLDKLYSYAKSMKKFEEIPRFPGVLLDIAVVVDKETRVSELEKTIREKGGGLLKSIDLFDVYQGDQLEEGKKSIAFSLRFRANDRTLGLNEIKKIHGRIVDKLSALGAELRS